MIKAAGRAKVKACCLTSHAGLPGRSADEWAAYCKEKGGPDVKALRSNNRLDIVVRLPADMSRSVGIEVKCLGSGNHARKLTQGVGQAILALAQRDRTLMMIHCGTVSPKEREHLRTIAKDIFRGMKRISMVVVP